MMDTQEKENKLKNMEEIEQVRLSLHRLSEKHPNRTHPEFIQLNNRLDELILNFIRQYS